MSSDSFRIHEFARRAGVTVKALRHYDRLGLLSAPRTMAGHRVYSPRDLARVKQITTLKLLGLPLRRIKSLLEAGGPPLRAILREQRDVLGERHRILGHAIQSLGRAERALQAAPADEADILRRLVEDLAMGDDIDMMRQYYSDDVWSEWRAHYEHWPSEPWRALYRDINAAIDEDPDLAPGSDMAQALATRWLDLDARDTTVPAVRTGLRRAWAHRDQWPETLRRQFAVLDVERAARFVTTALWERWDAERVAREQAGSPPARVSDARQALFQDGAALLRFGPDSREVRDLVQRWRAVVDEESGGDEATKAELLAGFRHRVYWPPGLLRTVAASYRIDAKTWAAVADLVEAAHDAVTAPTVNDPQQGASSTP